MKKLCFPATFRGHLARQQLLLEELKKDFEVDIWQPQTKNEGGMNVFSILCAVEFNNFLATRDYDCVLIRGDRFEMLGLAMVAAYRGIKIAHIEGGDLSGAIDNKVRHAITNLSDYHFCTNEESHKRLLYSGVPIDKVWNFGSLDVEFAKTVEPEMKEAEPYIFVAYHPIEGEDENEVLKAIEDFRNDYKLIGIKSNKDYGIQMGNEEYSPEDYINLMRFASCCVGNSSSLLKEASIMGVPVVNVGNRQMKRLKPKNVLDVTCEAKKIKAAIQFQIDNEWEADMTYYKPETSKAISLVLKEIL